MSSSHLLPRIGLLVVGGVVGGVIASAASGVSGEKSHEKVFELRTYTTEEGRLDALGRRFRDYTARLFEKHGMTNVGYWTPTDEPRSRDTLIYVLAHDSREAAKKSWDGFLNDPEWHQARDASEADGKIVKKVESVFMKATDYSAIK